GRLAAGRRSGDKDHAPLVCAQGFSMADTDTSTRLAATVIARAADMQSRDIALSRIAEAFPPAGEIDLLGPEAGVAFLAAAPLDEAREAAREAVAGLPVDVAVEPAAGRRKKLFIADMDSTMIGQECIDELA